MKALIVTNGHGEDQLAVCLVHALRHEWPELKLEAIPLVGSGDRLHAAGVAVAGPRVQMPSGGMVRPQAATIWRDLRAGLIRQFRRQQQFVRSRRGIVQKVIAVGDVFAGWVAGRALPELPLVLVATAKSEYIHGHFLLESRWMRRRATHVFARDERTAEALRQAGVAASWVGNLMMDAFTVSGRQVVEPSNRRVIGLLPGSREDAYVNLQHLASVLEQLSGDEPHYLGLVPLAPGLRMERAVALLLEDGWQSVKNPGSTDLSALQDEHLPVRLKRGAARLDLIEGAFGDVLIAAELVIGLAGTANEQAAGLGKPVVAFPGPGVQFSRRFLRAQQLLLGEALAVTSPEPAAIAAQVKRILADDALRERMGATGRERMGPPGAAGRMAAAIASLWRV